MSDIYDGRKRVMQAKKIWKGFNKQAVAGLLVLLLVVFSLGAYSPFEIKAKNMTDPSKTYFELKSLLSQFKECKETHN